MHHVDSQITPGCVQLKDLQLDNDVHYLFQHQITTMQYSWCAL